MSAIDVQLANRALILIGSTTITSLTDEGDEALAVNTLYEAALEALLGRYRWRFASAMEQLSRLASAPEHKWDAAYQMPNTIIALHGVYVNDQPIDYDTYENRIYCDATVNDAVYADYTFRPDETKWPAYFKTAFVFELASMLATSIGGDPDIASVMGERAKSEYLFATHQESGNQTTRKIRTNRFINARGSNRR